MQEPKPGSTYRYVLIRYDIYNLGGVLEGSFQEERFAVSKKQDLEKVLLEKDAWLTVVKSNWRIFTEGIWDN